MNYELIKLTRPHHWVKNLFVFLPIFFGQKLLDVHLLYNATLAFLSFCFVASSIYCFNDIIDVEDDRRHPVKCQRPVASGKISMPVAYGIMGVLMVMSVGVLFFISDETFRYTTIAVIVAYWVMEHAYCILLKRFAIVDVCILSLGFILRILAGGMATGTVISHWLIMMTFLLTLFLGIAKRRDDVLRMMRTGIPVRHNTKRYNLTFVNEALTITGSVMLVCYIMYTVSPDVMAQFDSQYLYLTSAFVVLGLLRYMQLAVVDEKTGDPTKVLLHDRFTQCVVVGWMVSFLIIIYV
ncbi:MAG: decaprenyl-phosphate phosphoribosyltransferase [Prevotella sp.]|nr:decaprenyl-phosphate phosphoribosyltransferase [Prevotella sp.]MBQ9237335.1 decaprenyl-phosphate phosphoribosyltransferase [Prevotella sp.]MBR1839547.1 decaprenyl-phosphate phosphoribosyltransferase [Prevotella sp.]